MKKENSLEFFEMLNEIAIKKCSKYGNYIYCRNAISDNYTSSTIPDNLQEKNRKYLKLKMLFYINSKNHLCEVTNKFKIEPFIYFTMIGNYIQPKSIIYINEVIATYYTANDITTKYYPEVITLKDLMLYERNDKLKELSAFALAEQK
jgi:hypothetical protein